MNKATCSFRSNPLMFIIVVFVDIEQCLIGQRPDMVYLPPPGGIL